MEQTKAIPLRVIVYLDSDSNEWVAHVLEFDIVGTGDTPELAQEQLRDAIDCHVSFCLQEEMSPMSPAPKRLFDIWNGVQAREISQSDKVSSKDYRLSSIPYERRVDKTVYNQFSVS